MEKYICIHGHFYQPPRENPWLEEIECQDSAYPYHDWNERISAECYQPNVASRILDNERKIINIVNNYSKISFNFGPTLLSWMERHDPETYKAILEADKKSLELYNGHGSALAQVYNHMIMPLANSRDKRTQIIWGIKDFEHRFKRKPEGMWLAETAVDLETLEILAEQNISFTILAPRQAHRCRKIEGGRWRIVKDGRIDPKMPYRCNLPSGKSIVLFFYDGLISQDIAFSGLLDNGETFANRLISAFTPDSESAQLVHIATDGETYGHHHRKGEMALTYCLYNIESKNLAQITVYGDYLAKYPPREEVEIFENSSWSCIHGIERWKSNCGCNSGGNVGWNQQWRAPLREALDWLRDHMAQVYEKTLSKYNIEPWDLRNDYIEMLLDRDTDAIQEFFKKHVKRKCSKEEETKILKLLESQRHAMLMYTSCGWFFDELSGIETVQIIQYAARALQLVKEISGISLESSFIGLLERAKSNIAQYSHGAHIYELFVQPAMLDLKRVGVHYAVSSLFKEYEQTTLLFNYSIKEIKSEKIEIGRQKLVTGLVEVQSLGTLEKVLVSFAVAYLGDHNIVGGVREYVQADDYEKMRLEIIKTFQFNQVSELIHAIDKHFKTHNYSLWHLFRDEQRAVLNQMFTNTEKEMENYFRQIYDRYYPAIRGVGGLNMALPKHLLSVLEYVLNADIRNVLKQERVNLLVLRRLVDDVKHWKIKLDNAMLSYLASNRIDQLFQQWAEAIDNIQEMVYIKSLLFEIEKLKLDLDIWKAQNLYFTKGKTMLDEMIAKRDQGDLRCNQWIDAFDELGHLIKVRVV
ncbi:MAG: DUF3536 domain-containing protein [Candidatus Omnitrophica bacterium]|nr:DUF3536 domain-containing protein [Candidatus Omnitrophota bacterium]